MDVKDLERRLLELKTRCAKLSPADQERALDGFAQVLTLIELPREPGETVALKVSLDRSPDVTYPSG